MVHVAEADQALNQAQIDPQKRPFYDRWFLRFINDPRDLPFVHLMIQCAICAGAGLSLFFVKEHFWWYAVAYWALWGLWVLDRFILMLHCTSHRRLFKSKYRIMNHVIPWLLGPFFGETPETYFAHHMGMHHPENNLLTDLSTTMKYRRDRLSDWLVYFIKFFLFAMIELPIYHVKKGNAKMAVRLLVGEVSFWTVAFVLAFVNLKASLAVFVIPLCVVRVLMMAGNWAQHAFVDLSDPANAYKNSITCINSRYNRRCFNDGYHIHHHINARCHWSDYPHEFKDNMQTYGKEDAIVFEGVDFFMVWAMLMLKRWDALAKRFVQLPGAPQRSHEEIVALLKSRSQPA